VTHLPPLPLLGFEDTSLLRKRKYKSSCSVSTKKRHLTFHHPQKYNSPLI